MVIASLPASGIGVMLFLFFDHSLDGNSEKISSLPQFFFQGSLRNSHQISPQEFLGELKSGVVDERLFACLDSLRVSLTSNPVRYGA